MPASSSGTRALPLGAALLLATSLLLAGACEPAAPSTARRGVQRGVGTGAPPRPATRPPLPAAGSRPDGTRAPARHRVYRPLVERREAEAQGPPGTPTAAAEAEAATAPRAPTLGELVRDAFGSPLDCLSEGTRRELPADGTLQVDVTVHVSLSGRVTRAEVRSTPLPEEDRLCLQRQAEGLQVPGPVEGAPRAVTTTLLFRIRREEPAPPPEEPLPPRLGLAPDLTLEPAGTATERPAGSLPPSSTLPAMTEEGRPPGFVPPSSTLPALAE
ncbi:MAG: hypothetical protein ACFCGT_09260 [Sandaracinaceae bacterium]